MREPGERRGEGNRGKSSGCPREKFHPYEELDELSVGVAGGSLCGVFWNYTLSLSGAFVGRRIVFHQIYIRLERHPTLIHGEKFRLAGWLGPPGREVDDSPLTQAEDAVDPATHKQRQVGECAERPVTHQDI